MMRTHFGKTLAALASVCLTVIPLTGCGNAAHEQTNAADSTVQETTVSVDMTSPVSVAEAYLTYMSEGKMSEANKLLDDPVDDDELLPDEEYAKATGKITDIVMGSGITETSGDKGDFVPASYSINGKTHNDSGVWVTNFRVPDGEYRVSTYSTFATTYNFSGGLVSNCGLVTVPGTLEMSCDTKYGTVTFDAVDNGFGHNSHADMSNIQLQSSNEKLTEAFKEPLTMMLDYAVAVCEEDSQQSCSTSKKNTTIVEQPKVVDYKVLDDGYLYIATTAVVEKDYNGVMKKTTVGTTADPVWYRVGSGDYGIYPVKMGSDSASERGTDQLFLLPD